MIDEFRLSKQIQDEIGYEAPSPGFAARGYLSDRLAVRPDQSPRRHLRGERNLQWLAVAVAALLGIAVVAGLMLTRLEQRAGIPGDYGQPPAGVPLLYVRDPNHATWYIGFDWSGRPRGTVKLPHPLRPGQSLVMAPDGQLFEITPGGKAGAGEFLDRLGRRIPGSPPYADGGIWADDNRHLCLTIADQTHIKWTFATQLPGEAPKTVAVVHAATFTTTTGFRYPGPSEAAPIACGIGNDNAIVLGTATGLVYGALGVGPLPVEMWFVRLSDGTVINGRRWLLKTGTHLIFWEGLTTHVVTSRDGVYYSGSTFNGVYTSSMFTDRPPAHWSGVIGCRPGFVPCGPVAALPPNIGVLGFSADDSLALVTTLPVVAGQASVLEVINVRSGQVVWRGQGSSVYSGFTAKPGGRDFAISFGVTGSQKSGAVQMGPTLSTILIVNGDGSVTKLPQPYLPTW
ncbi:MAG: hypothetical protein M3082_06145 [Candidatus Dormibacteraeota bacterium]|nr:hypothetical protein [Candidatus Dormibacteraeota bacterium]